MEALLTSWRWVQEVWKLMTLKKYNFYREVNPMTRVYSELEMVVFVFSITVGNTFFYSIPLHVLKHGDLLMLFWLLYTPILFITAGCFAEMAALMPAVGAHYHYCYSTICEFVAFLVGWHLIFAYTAITMSRCKFLSEFIDNNLLDGWVSRNLKFRERFGVLFFCIPGYVDILSPMLAISMAFQAAWAVNFSKGIVNFFTTTNVIIIAIIIIAFTAKMDFTYASISKTEESEKLYDALFVVQKALVGYESLSVLGEEAKNPTTTIPLSIMSSVRILMGLYIIYTVVVSICVKKTDPSVIDLENPLGSIVILVGMPWLYWIVTLGSISSLWCSAYGSMFITIRILYAMSRDGMIFKLFSKLDRYTKKPAIPAMIFGIFVGLVATFIYVDTSVWFFSLIWAKIMTTVCLLITRFRYENKPLASKSNEEKPKEEEDREEKYKNWVLINYPEYNTQPTKTTHSISMFLIYNTVILVLSSIFCAVILYHTEQGDLKEIFKITGFLSILFCFLFSYLLKHQPTNDRTNLSFLTPQVPTFPLVSIAADFLSSLLLCQRSWLYGVIWTILGVAFYFSYSIRNSQEGRNLFADGTRWNPLESHMEIDGRSNR